MTDLQIKQMKELFLQKGYTLFLQKGNKTFYSKQKGIAPLVDLIDKKTDVRGFFAMDKIVGKAAAFLYTILGAKEVFAFVTTKEAMRVLENANIKVQYETLTCAVQNRTKTGLCPMETAVLDMQNANDALIAIRVKREQMQKIKNKENIL